jgi:hypothetical protein
MGEEKNGGFECNMLIVERERCKRGGHTHSHKNFARETWTRNPKPLCLEE